MSSTKRQFVVLAGKHFENGKEYKKDDIVPSQYDLAKLFPNKFRPVTAEQAAEQAATVEADKKAAKPAPAPDADKEGGDEDEGFAGFGDDVTADFEAAEKAHLKVFKKAGKFNVVEPKDKKVLNKDPLTKIKVGDFIEEYLSE